MTETTGPGGVMDGSIVPSQDEIEAEWHRIPVFARERWGHHVVNMVQMARQQERNLPPVAPLTLELEYLLEAILYRPDGWLEQSTQHPRFMRRLSQKECATALRAAILSALAQREREGAEKAMDRLIYDFDVGMMPQRMTVVVECDTVTSWPETVKRHVLRALASPATEYTLPDREISMHEFCSPTPTPKGGARD